MSSLLVDFPRPQPSSSTAKNRINNMDVDKDTRKSVSFSKFSEMMIIKRIPYTDKDKQVLWYSSEDVRLFKLNYAYMAQQLTSVTSIDLISLDSAVFLGLEGCIDTALSCCSTQQRRQDMQSAVLLEQLRQQSLGIHDPCAMAKRSEYESQVSRERAQLIAKVHLS